MLDLEASLLAWTMTKISLVGLVGQLQRKLGRSPSLFWSVLQLYFHHHLHLCHWHCELQYTKVRSFLSLSLSYFISSISAFISFSTFFPSSLSPVPSSPSSFLPSFSYPNSSSSQSPFPSPTTLPSQSQLLTLRTSMNWRQVFLHYWTSFSPHFCLNCLILIPFSLFPCPNISYPQFIEFPISIVSPIWP